MRLYFVFVVISLFVFIILNEQPNSVVGIIVSVTMDCGNKTALRKKSRFLNHAYFSNTQKEHRAIVATLKPAEKRNGLFLGDFPRHCSESEAFLMDPIGLPS